MATAQRGSRPRNAGVEPKRSGRASDHKLRRILAEADFSLGLVGTIANASFDVPKNIPTSVPTSVQASTPQEAQEIIASLPTSYRIVGLLSGPSFTSPQPVSAPVGTSIPIEALTRAGTHLLQNLRIIDTNDPNAATVAPVEPSTCEINVIEQILISSVTVNELSYDDIIQSGIQVSDDSYSYYNFTLGVATDSGVVPINVPVAFPNLTLPEVPPVVGVPSVEPGVAVPNVIPDVLPIMLEPRQLDGNVNVLPDLGDYQAHIPGVIVFPGRIGFLNQFFEAIVIVANGAPNGSPLTIRNVTVTATLPSVTPPPLRIPATGPGGPETVKNLHGLGPDGEYNTGDDTFVFGPGQTGQASFYLEGLEEGLHTVEFCIDALLDGLPSGDGVPLRGVVPGTVLVRDIEFSVTFTHPATVRKNQEYEVALTI